MINGKYFFYLSFQNFILFQLLLFFYYVQFLRKYDVYQKLIYEKPKTKYAQQHISGIPDPRKLLRKLCHTYKKHFSSVISIKFRGFCKKFTPRLNYLLMAYKHKIDFFRKTFFYRRSLIHKHRRSTHTRAKGSTREPNTHTAKADKLKQHTQCQFFTD